MTRTKVVSKAEKARRRDGRPSLFKTEYCEQAHKLCKLGSTDLEIADFFGVCERTVNNWKHDHPEFLQSIKVGKLLADANVAEALYRRAVGYSHPDTHVSVWQGEVTLTELTKHYPPDTAAAFIWLKNRRPDQWRDKVVVDAEISVNRMDPAYLEEKFVSRMREAHERQIKVLEERGVADV